MIKVQVHDSILDQKHEAMRVGPGIPFRQRSLIKNLGCRVLPALPGVLLGR